MSNEKIYYVTDKFIKFLNKEEPFHYTATHTFVNRCKYAECKNEIRITFPKKKVKMYVVLYKTKDNHFFTSHPYRYHNLEEFTRDMSFMHDKIKPVQLIQESMIETESDEE